MAFLTDKENPEVPLLDFQPDEPMTKPGIILDMQNGFPTANGFQTLPSGVNFTGQGLGFAPIGSALAYFSDGTAAIYVASKQHIYKKTLPVVLPISYPGTGVVEADGGQTFAATTPWQFFQFGDDVFALAGGVVPQIANGSANPFGPAPGSPPMGATNGVAAGGVAFMFKGSNWFNSATGDDKNWVPNIQTQAGSGNLYDFPGPVTACATLFRNVLMFKQNAIWLAQFQGQSTAPWSVQVISDFTGTWGQGCVVPLPNAVAFVGTDDFYLTTGYTPQAIPNSLRKWFFANAPLAYRQLITSRFDPETSVVFWYFVSNNNPAVRDTSGQFAPDLATTGTGQPPAYPDRWVAWNTKANRWGTGYVNNLIAPIPLLVPTLPLIYTQLLIQNANIFIPPGPLDMTRTFIFQLVGTPGTMSLTTGWMGMARHLSQIFRVRAKYNVNSPLLSPNVAPNTSSLIPYHAISLSQTPIQEPAAVLGADDWFNIIQYDRWHRFVLATTGPVEVQGFAYEGRIGGLV